MEREQKDKGSEVKGEREKRRGPGRESEQQRDRENNREIESDTWRGQQRKKGKEGSIKRYGGRASENQKIARAGN